MSIMYHALVVIALPTFIILVNASSGSGHKNLPDIAGMFNVKASPSKNAGGSNSGDVVPLAYGHTSGLCFLTK